MGEDGGQLTGALGKVKPSAPGGGELAEEGDILPIPDGDDGSGDFVGPHAKGGAEGAFLVFAIVAIGKEDVVANLRGFGIQHFLGLGHGGSDVDAAAVDI